MIENADDRNYWWHKIFFAVTFVTVEPDPMEQWNLMRKMHCCVGVENMSIMLAGHHGWNKTGHLISSRWYFPQIYLWVCEMIKYYPQCLSMNTSWLHKSSKVLQPIPVPLRHCSTKTSPFKILYGCEPKLLFEMDYEIKKGNPVAPSVQALEEQWEEKSGEEKIEAMLSIRQQVLVEVAGNIKKLNKHKVNIVTKFIIPSPLKLDRRFWKKIKRCQQKGKAWAKVEYTPLHHNRH